MRLNRLPPWLIAAGPLTALALPAYGQVTLDGSLCSNRTCQLQLIDNQYRITADLGTTVGQNLFHSFDQFSLTAEQMAVFSGPAGLANVISRVTGGQVSNIDGTLQSTITGANFFFVNPAGVVFKPNARLDVSGSFVVTTAGALHLADGGVFGASIDPDNSVLTSDAPSAFGFLAASPAGVSIQGATLSVQEGESLSVIAGDVDVTEGTLGAPAGQVNVVNVRSSGQVAFTSAQQAVGVELDAFERLGQLEVRDGSSIDVDGNGGGRVVIRGGRLILSDSAVTARTSGDTDGRGVDIVARDEVGIVRGRIDTRSENQGNSGGVQLVTDTLVLDARDAVDEVGIFTDSLALSVPVHAGLSVKLDITHTFDADVEAVLESPAGTRVVLFGGVGGSGDDFTDTLFDDRADTPIADGSAPFTGTFQPEESFTALIGESAHGQWVLEVADSLEDDEGTLNTWSLQVGQSVFESTDVGQTISDDQAPIQSSLQVDVPGLVVTGPGGSTPGYAGDIQIESNMVEVFDNVSLSATAQLSAGNIHVSTPTILVNGVEGSFAVVQQGLGRFFVIGGLELDGTLGPAGPLQGPDFSVTADLGTLSGSNLFHSFSRFDLSRGQTATFSGPTSVANVISRVTSGQVSNIDGTLRSTITWANFFLINPAGVVFGPDAHIDVRGAFTVTTADVLALAEDGRLAVSTDPSDSVLTDAAPVTFGFLTEDPAGVSIQGATLRVEDGASLTVIAGDVEVTGGTLKAPGGQVNVVNVASSGQVAFESAQQAVVVELDAFERLGQLEVRDGSSIDADGDGGGRVVIRGGRLILSDSTVTARTLGDFDSRGIDIVTTEQVSIVRGKIDTRSNGRGNSGGVHLATDILVLDARDAVDDVGIFTDASNLSMAARADLNVTLDITHTFDADVQAVLESPAGTRVLLFAGVGGDGANFVSTTLDDGAHMPITDGSAPFTGLFRPRESLTTLIGESAQGEWVLEVIDTFPDDDGMLNSWSLRIGQSVFESNNVGQTISDDQAPVRSTLPVGVSGLVIRGFTPGLAADIDIEARVVEIRDGASLSTIGSVEGGGDISILASEAIILSGAGFDDFGSTISAETFGDGDAGSIRLEAPIVQLQDGGGLSTSTAGIGIGAGGSIEVISSGSLTLSSAFILAETGGDGDAGSIRLEAPIVQLQDGAFVSTSTPFDGIGAGGGIEVIASDSITLSGIDPVGFFASSVLAETLGDGDAGSIRLEAPIVQLQDGAFVSTRTLAGLGAGGSIVVIASETIILSGTGLDGAGSVISAATEAEGNAGAITILAPSLEMVDGAQISTTTTSTGAGGAIRLDVGELQMARSATVEALSEATDDGAGTAGSITVTAAGSIALSDQSTIATSAANTDGGNISVLTGHDLALTAESKITAEAERDGGNVIINTPHFLRLQDSRISVEAVVNGGNISIDPLLVDLQGESFITANAVRGNGGNITIQTAILRRSSQSRITASSQLGLSGIVNINSILDVTGTLVPVSAWLLDTEAQLQPHCVAQFGASETSSFTVTGRGGTPIRPGGWLPSVDLAVPDDARAADTRRMVAQDGGG